MFFKAPIIDGTLDIDYLDLRNAITVSDIEAVAELQDNAVARESWISLTKDEWLTVYEAAPLTSNKIVILADGVDEAIISAAAPVGMSQVTFYNIDDGVAIATIPVNVGNQCATLTVTAATAGTISIRAGKELPSKENEVRIRAS